ncbi:DUF2878 domain-containing protein [Vibrio caribbeanicus]|uniref:DUF2878 domain-containing protein n=1 Tax=Vibrio caribbeanicus TaxID=701175 RepID=UPI00228394D4|nr:DUF2878 domain-containing protein [Vibrio caribbeanicus]MCY9843383.1 DUF2878 domain-containing protein [Vibrio caribbeanicus]
MKKFIAISLWFQCLWVLAVVGNYNAQYITLGLAIFTLLLTKATTDFPWIKFFFIATLGILIDYVNIQLGILDFQQSSLPIWLISLWLVFVWYAYFLYQVIQGYSFFLISTCGAVGGSMSYLGGEKLGAVSFSADFNIAMTALTVEWFVIVYVLLKVFSYERQNVAS